MRELDIGKGLRRRRTGHRDTFEFRVYVYVNEGQQSSKGGKREKFFTLLSLAVIASRSRSSTVGGAVGKRDGSGTCLTVGLALYQPYTTPEWRHSSVAPTSLPYHRRQHRARSRCIHLLSSSFQTIPSITSSCISLSFSRRQYHRNVSSCLTRSHFTFYSRFSLLTTFFFEPTKQKICDHLLRFFINLVECDNIFFRIFCLFGSNSIFWTGLSKKTRVPETFYCDSIIRMPSFPRCSTYAL